MAAVAPGGGEVELARGRGGGNEGKDRLRSGGRGGGQLLVTVCTSNCGMFTGERELRFRMCRDGDFVVFESLLRVALTALFGGELPAVRVVVAVRTGQQAGDVDGFAPLWLVALRAVEFGVTRFEAERRLLMHRAIEQRWLEAVFVVARLAVCTGRTAGELLVVRILMAGRAAVVRDLAMEIGILMTFVTGDVGMLALQSKWGPVVTETGGGDAGATPSGGAVAAVAGASDLGLAKGAAMRVFVTALAGLEGQSLELRGRRVTLDARHLLVETSEGEAGLRMVETAGGLPAFGRMALGAIRTELALMLVLMAGVAFAAQTKERVIHIFHFDLCTRGSRNVFRSMAGLTGNGPVFAFQFESGLGFVLEGFAVEADQAELRTIVLAVTAGAVLLPAGCTKCPGVKSSLCGYAPLDLGMAFQTPK